MAPRDAQTPPLEESFAAAAFYPPDAAVLDTARDHVPQCVLPTDDRKARMCPRPRPLLPLLLRAAAAVAAAAASCGWCCCFELLLLLLLQDAASAAATATTELRAKCGQPSQVSAGG